METDLYLSREDLARLPLGAKQAISQVISRNRSEEKFVKGGSLGGFFSSFFSEPVALNAAQALALVAKLGDPACRLLKHFATAKTGTTDLRNILEATGYKHYRDLAAVSSDLKECLLEILGREGCLIGRRWLVTISDQARTLHNAEYYVTQPTLETLRLVLQVGAGDAGGTAAGPKAPRSHSSQQRPEGPPPAFSALAVGQAALAVPVPEPEAEADTALAVPVPEPEVATALAVPVPEPRAVGGSKS